MSKGIGECERAGAVRSMSGKEGGEGPKVTRGLRETEVVIGRRDDGRGEAERAAAVGREEELEEELEEEGGARCPLVGRVDRRGE